MSDRTPDLLLSLAHEMTGLSIDYLHFSERLHLVAPNLVSAEQVQLAEQRVDRLRSLLQQLKETDNG